MVLIRGGVVKYIIKCATFVSFCGARQATSRAAEQAALATPFCLHSTRCVGVALSGGLTRPQLALNVEIANPHHLLGAAELAKTDVGGIDGIAAVERVGTGLVDDGL